MKPKLLAGGALGASIAVHAGLLLQRSDGAARVRPRPPSLIAFSLASAPALAKAPPPLAPAPPPARPRPALKPKPTPASATPPAREAEAPVEAASAPELTGTTLVSDVGVGWSAPAGNGEARVGAVGTDHALLASRSAAAAAPVADPPRARLPAAIPLAALSRKPTPPSLSASLARNYPQTARNMGQNGEASVQALVEASGEVQRAKVTTESSSGFGEACRRSLIGSRWGVPLDRAGRPVATWITYRCKFRVDD
jgi:hypothetical protein